MAYVAVHSCNMLCRGCSSVVERSLRMREAPGSNPGISNLFRFPFHKTCVISEKIRFPFQNHMITNHCWHNPCFANRTLVLFFTQRARMCPSHPIVLFSRCKKVLTSLTKIEKWRKDEIFSIFTWTGKNTKSYLWRHDSLTSLHYRHPATNSRGNSYKKQTNLG